MLDNQLNTKKKQRNKTKTKQLKYNDLHNRFIQVIPSSSVSQVVQSV